MIRGHQLGIRGYAQAGCVGTARLQALDLLEQSLQIHHTAVADDGHGVFGKHAGGKELQLVLLATHNHGVTCVIATVWLDHVIDMFAENIGGLALTFIAPLGTDDNNCWHKRRHVLKT